MGVFVKYKLRVDVMSETKRGYDGEKGNGLY